MSCGKKDLSKDEVGINLKLIGEDTENFYCLDCLASVLDVGVQDILDKIEEFKEEAVRCFCEVKYGDIADNAATTQLDTDAFEAMNRFCLKTTLIHQERIAIQRKQNRL